MNENVIFVINYILYSAFSSTLFIAEQYVFDFKISRLRYALRCFICIMPLSILKFVLPVDSVVGVCTIPVIQMLVIVLLITSVNGNIFKNICIHSLHQHLTLIDYIYTSDILVCYDFFIIAVVFYSQWRCNQL